MPRCKCARLLAEPKNRCHCGARDSLHLRCGLSGAGEHLKIFSAYGSRSNAGVSLLVGRNPDADVDVVFAGDLSRLVVAVKSFTFWLVEVYAPNTAVKRVSFFVGWCRSEKIRSG